jgi:hypothetical protein
MCHACTTTNHFIQTWWHVIPNRIQVMLDSTYGEQEQILYYAFDHTCYYNMVVRYNRRNELFGTPLLFKSDWMVGAIIIVLQCSIMYAIFVSGFRVCFELYMARSARTGFPLIIPEQGIACKIWDWDQRRITWELRYILSDLGIMKPPAKWLKRNLQSIAGLVGLFGLEDAAVLRSRRSISASVPNLFAQECGNRELQLSTPLVLALHARIASDARHYDAVPRALSESRLRYWCKRISAENQTLQIPFQRDDNWHAVRITLSDGVLIDLGRCADVIDDARTAPHDLASVLIAMARGSSPRMVQQAPSLLNQTAHLVDLALRDIMQCGPHPDHMLLPCIRGPSGTKVRRVDPATLLYVSESRSGASRCIRGDTSSAMAMHASTGSRVDCMSVDLYVNRMQSTFQHMRRLHLAIDGACYSRRETILGAVYAPKCRSAAILRQKVASTVACLELNLHVLVACLTFVESPKVLLRGSKLLEVARNRSKPLETARNRSNLVFKAPTGLTKHAHESF